MRFLVTLKPDYREMLDALAVKWGVSLASAVRRAILEAYTRECS